MLHILHLLSGLEYGGKEKAALRLARRAMDEGYFADLILYDLQYRSEGKDFDPGRVPWKFMKRKAGLDINFARSLASHCVAEQIDVVHAHNETAGVYAGLAARFVPRKKPRVVTTFHTRPSHGGRLARLLSRNAVQKPSHVYAVSEQLAAELVETGWVKKCRVIPNGVDTVEFAPAGPATDLRQGLTIPRDHFILGHVARFAPIKRHDDLISAMELLEIRGCPVTVVCVGQGPLLQLAKERGNALRNLRIVDSVSKMPDFLRSLDGVILCSEHEATPMVLLEAMACGKPAIATSVGGVPALLGDRSGILVPSLEPKLLADAIERFSANAALRSELSRACVKRAYNFEFEFEWIAYNDAYLKRDESVNCCSE